MGQRSITNGQERMYEISRNLLANIKINHEAGNKLSYWCRLKSIVLFIKYYTKHINIYIK